jgi:hypothetical protein
VHVLREFVVTNHRFTDEFREKLVEKTLSAAPIILECESISLEGNSEKKSFSIISESVNMMHGVFFCTGHTNDHDFFRLEEEKGTLILTVT